VPESITITDNRSGESIEIPIVDGGVDSAEWSKLLPGVWFYDPGFSTSAFTRSSVSYIDGDAGILRYRGYPIEQLAERSSYLEVAYLLLHGELPNREGLVGAVDVMVRPESLAVDTLPPPGHTTTRAVVVSRRFYGHDQLLELRLDSGRTVRARRLGFPAWHPGDRVRVWIDGPADVLARD